MTSAAATQSDRIEIPRIVRLSIILGIIQAVIVALFAVVTRLLDGPVEKVLEAVLLVIGLGATIILPGLWTRARNIAGIAGISLPCGFTHPAAPAGSTEPAKPLPIGLQLLGPAFGEEKLLRAARMFESATNWHKRRPMLETT